MKKAPPRNRISYFFSVATGLPKYLLLSNLALFAGEFRGGRLWGKGLLSYKDGSPGTEGYFQDVRFSRECSASEDVKKAREVAIMAKSFCESDTDY